MQGCAAAFSQTRRLHALGLMGRCSFAVSGAGEGPSSRVTAERGATGKRLLLRLEREKRPAPRSCVPWPARNLVKSI